MDRYSLELIEKEQILRMRNFKLNMTKRILNLIYKLNLTWRKYKNWM